MNPQPQILPTKAFWKSKQFWLTVLQFAMSFTLILQDIDLSTKNLIIATLVFPTLKLIDRTFFADQKLTF